MSNAVIYDYFSFMSEKSGSRAVAPDPLAVLEPAKAMGLTRATDRTHESQIEVTESALSDSVIERIFRQPAVRPAPNK